MHIKKSLRLKGVSIQPLQRHAHKSHLTGGKKKNLEISTQAQHINSNFPLNTCISAGKENKESSGDCLSGHSKVKEKKAGARSPTRREKTEQPHQKNYARSNDGELQKRDR